MAGRFKVVVDRLEDNLAILRTIDGQELMVNISLLPTGVKEGSHINIFFEVDATSAQASDQQARNLLSDITKNKHAKPSRQNN